MTDCARCGTPESACEARMLSPLGLPCCPRHDHEAEGADVGGHPRHASRNAAGSASASSRALADRFTKSLPENRKWGPDD